MTTPDLDRRLDTFLADGPARAPERPIEAALAHARAHPRRRDPFRALRRDPMGRPWFGGSPVVRGLVLVTVLGALLVASVALAAVGGLFDRPAVVVPEPSPTPSPVVTPSPTPRRLIVDLEEVAGADATIEILDPDGLVASARSGTPADGGSVADGEVRVQGADGDAFTLVLTWTDLPCTTEHVLEVADDGRSLTIVEPVCEGDATVRDLVLHVTFSAPIDPATVEARTRPATQP